MSIKGKSYIVGIYEHPTRLAQDKTVPMLHAECAQGALARRRADARTTSTAISAPPATRRVSAGCRWSITSGLKLRHINSTDTGGSSYLLQVGHVAEAIAAGKCSVALITLAGRPRAEGMATGTAPRAPAVPMPEIGLRAALRAGHREHVRDVRDAPHARIRHDQRADGLGQGRRLAPRAVQPARDAARRRDGRGGRQFADDRRPAAPARLLRHQRRRRRDHHGHARRSPRA